MFEEVRDFLSASVNNPLYFSTIAFTCPMFAHNYLSPTAKSDEITLDAQMIEKVLMTQNIDGV